MKACFGMTSGEKSLPVFFYKHWAPFCEMKQRCAPFCSDFHGFCPTFQGFCPDLNKSTSFGVQLHPSTPASCTTVVTATFVESSVAKSSLALRGMCDLPRTGCVSRITPILKWHEQAFTEWSWRVLSIVTCCHSVKLCVHICRSGLPITTKWCCDQNVKFVPGADFTNERAISAVRWKRRGCCCNLSFVVTLNVRFTTHRMCVKNNILKGVLESNKTESVIILFQIQDVNYNMSSSK